jgi:hypothetical protein
VVADNVQFLGRSGDGGEGGAPAAAGQRSRGNARPSSQDDVDLNEEDFDDIPF